MAIASKIFKSYDIRGVYPTDLTDDAAYRIGRAYAAYTGVSKVAVGRDMRLASPSLHKHLLAGLTEQGVAVDDLGLVSTDTFNFALNHYGYEGGIIITASHNPKEYGGFKLYGPARKQIYGEGGMPELQRLVMENTFTPASVSGAVHPREGATADYAAYCLGHVDVTAIKPSKVVLDAGSGMGSLYLDAVLPELPVTATRLYFELDGTFPYHEANPLKPENTVDVQERVKADGADFGFAFDADADRIMLIDEKGNRVGNDILTALIGRWMLRQRPGAAIVKQVVGSKTIDRVIGAAGGKVIASRVGTAYIKAAMRKHNAIFAGEISGHFYYDDFWLFDTGLLTFLRTLQMLSDYDQPVSALVAEIDHLYRSGEINSEVESIDAKIAEVASHFKDGEVDTTDGYTVHYPDWWFNVRPSNTEPLLRLNVEAETKALMEEKRDRLLEIIRSK